MYEIVYYIRSMESDILTVYVCIADCGTEIGGMHERNLPTSYVHYFKFCYVF